MSRHLILAAIAVFFMYGFSSASRAAEIISVERVSEAQGDLSGSRTLGKTVEKFTVRELPSGREELVVTWSPGPMPVPAGAKLVVEYQRAGERRVRKTEVSFPMTTQSQRETRIDVSKDGGRFNGGVARWLVTLVDGEKVLARKASSSWR